MAPAGWFLCSLIAANAIDEPRAGPGAPGEPELDQPSREWAPGLQGLAELDAWILPANGAGAALTIRPRFGFDVRGVFLEAGIDWSASFSQWLDAPVPQQLGLSAPSLSVVAPDLVRDGRLGIALTPALSTTVPVGPSHTLTLASAQVRGDITWRQLRAGLVASGWRRVLLPSSQAQLDECQASAGACAFRGTVPYFWAARFGGLAEVELGSFSLGASAALEKQWGFFQARDELISSFLQVTSITQGNLELASYRVYVRWGFAPLFGLTLSGSHARPSGTPLAPSDIRFSLGVYGRTDQALNPEWLLP